MEGRWRSWSLLYITLLLILLVEARGSEFLMNDSIAATWMYNMMFEIEISVFCLCFKQYWFPIEMGRDVSYYPIFLLMNFSERDMLICR